jgi:lysophospholipase L1-like esterase
VSRSNNAKHIAVAAGVAAGLSGATTALGVALLKYEAQHARAVIGLPGEAPPTDGVYGTGEAAPLRMLVLGDSLAAGLGVGEARQTLAGSVATRLADERGRPVRLVNVAKIGAESVDLPGQLDRGLVSCPKPDVAMIVVGANDLTHGRDWSESLRELSGTIGRLRAAGSQIVVGTCPDIGTVQPIATPLRQLAGRQSVRYAGRQREVAAKAGAHVVPLGERLGPEFRTHPEQYFGPDRFHPSAEGYRLGADAMMPAVRTAADGRAPTVHATGRSAPARARTVGRRSRDSRRTREDSTHEPGKPLQR